ncbi:MAG: LCP family protein [Patescibacteria group bacterium]|nr:LCP family protein [Patescibacteria group bacterium]
MKINLIDTDLDRKARRTTIAVAAVFTLLVGILSTLGAGASYRSATNGSDFFSDAGGFFSLADIKRLVWGNADAAGQDIVNKEDGRLNVLILGIGGGKHDGSLLTDTIILASLDKKGNRVGMLSIPRDTAYPLGNGRFQKINAVNAYAEKEHPGEGARYTADAYSKLLGVRIDRVFRVDFQGFEDFVDALGGIEINVERSFTDNSFPTEENGPNPFKWTSVSFKKGEQTMDGHRALQFVRSRHGSNGEGSDFARSRRQQQVIGAIRDKLVSRDVLTDPKKISELWNTLSSHIQTDVTAWDALKLAPLALDFKDAKIQTHVLTDAADGELIPANVDGAFMLFPKKPDWSEIRALAADPFQSKEEVAAAAKPLEHVNLEIKNGTFRTGYAAQISTKLESLGYNINATGNATKRGFEKTIIYDLTGGKKPEELAKLKKMLSADVSSPTVEGKTVKPDEQTTETLYVSSTDFLIVLGDSSLGLINTYAVTSNP